MTYSIPSPPPSSAPRSSNWASASRFRLPALRQMFIRRIHTPRCPLSLCPSLRFLSTNTKPFSSKSKQTTSTSTTMPSYIVTCKEDATEEQIAAAKQHARDQGGSITHEYSLIKGFAVSFPEDSVHTLANHEAVNEVELDQEVRTQ